MKEKVPTKEQSSLKSTILSIVIPVIVTYLFTNYVFGLSRVPTGSMYPTIEYPSLNAVNHLSTEIGSIHRGEIVLFPFPDNPSLTFVKRVIGLPGDTITIHDGSVYINGSKLSEPYLTVKTLGVFGPFKVPAKHYFVMGDNRNNSDDGRFWHNKYVARTSISGEAVFQFWPHWRPIR